MAKKRKPTASASSKTRQVSGQPAQKRTTQAGQFKSKSAQRAARRQAMSRTRWGIIGGVALVALIILIIIGFQSQKPLQAEITVQEAYEMYDQGAFLLDVREQDEWDDYHIPNTTLIPLGQLVDRVSEVPRDQEVVVVCRSGNRSQEGRDILLEAGFEDVTSMAGGVLDWREAGYPIEVGTP